MIDQKDSDSQAPLARKDSDPSRLGRQLAAARRVRGLTQAEVAARARCSVRGLWLAERGQGSVALFIAAAAAAGSEIAGRALPSGNHLGARLEALRLRMGISRRELAARSNLSRTTIAALEGGQLGHLAVLERVGDTLNAGLGLVALGQSAAFFGSTALSSAWDSWASPAAVLDLVYAALGGTPDLDPCSPGRARCRVTAAVHYTEDDDGLSLPWHGRVYMNPPYGRTISHWTAKAVGEVAARRASVVIGLIPARTDTTWWHRDVAGNAHVCLIKGRLAFGDGRNAAPFPSAVVAWGASATLQTSLTTTFNTGWHVPPVRSSEIQEFGKVPIAIESIRT